ncbi:alcohol dehydrogenase catalytic domain-containing protein, partial [uncultured Agrococcus sp.]|uniref:alcohol dehydrogenase catalytic domain-containing protein n=1 Tax=uncultured Agrococcus sp. TaxID=382258 RepID=UPI0025F207B4
MKAWTHREYGGPEVMRLTDAALPEPEAHEVLVRVETVSINPVDWKIVGSPEKASNFGLSLPSGIANDVAGTIEEVGSNVVGWQVGDRIMTSARGRALQEYVVIDPTAVAVAHIPEQLDTAEAACVNIAARTAWDAVEGLSNARPGQTLLVHGGSGAVGQFAIQFA